MIGRTLSHHRITDRLGAGGMGEVYLAEDLKLKRKVALKVLPQDLATDPVRLERFQREAEALAALSHPNIVTIYSVEDIDGVRFITMELVEGRTLEETIPIHGLDLGRFFDLAVPLVDAVAAAHEHGITHRDLKPANVMVGKDGRLRILDFGLASVARIGSEIDETRTSEGTVLGTAAYMSPEQVEGLRVDHRSDVFSLGVMFCQALTGRRPFEGATWAALASSILRDAPQITSTRSAVPAAISRIVSRCLEKLPESRYQRARDLLSDLVAARRDIESGAVGAAPAGAVTQAIAVLPFQNMSADPENEYFSDGIAEEIINALMQIAGLRVAARTSSFSFKGKSVEIREIAKKLEVRHVLEGSVRKAGNRVRITAQLVEASTGYQLWSERFDRQLEDIFDVQDEIARAIVERLKIALSPTTAERLVKVATSNMEAYQLYLRGRALLYKRGTWIAPALESFRQAADRDPGYADAWAGQADAYTTLAYYGFLPSIETLPRALDAARRAVELDPGSAAAHGALALAGLLWDRDFKTAEREFLRALELNPSYTQARCWYALMYLQGTANHIDEGVEEARRAVELDPLSGYAIACYSYGLAQAHLTAEAVAQGHLAWQRDPESFIAGWSFANACHWNHQFDEAVAAYEQLLTASGRHPWALAGLAATFVEMGKHAEARGLHAELVALRASRYVQPTILALSAWAANDPEAAIGFCRQCVEERDAVFGIFKAHFPDLNGLRTDPRFAGIAAEFDLRRRD